jgi:hypothetical protein
VLGVVIAATLVIGIAAVVFDELETGPDHPSEWDPRVAELADFVEDERGLRFDHPVYVDFLTAAEYTEISTSEEGELDDTDRTELDRTVGQLRALGVASGPVDLFAALNQASDSGTFAFYDPADARVRVRGTEITVGLQATLVHELTHALQDQHFDLHELLDPRSDSGASTAGRALAEGDALRVEQAWVDELSGEEQDAYEQEYTAAVDTSVSSSPDVPGILQATLSAPYILGQPFVTMLLNDGGNDDVDDAFDDPPTTEEHLFDPASYVAGEEGDRPDLELDIDEDDIFDEDVFGSPSWFLVLAERIDPLVAFEATLGWAGDAYAIFERDDRTCVRAVFRGDEAEDESQMAAALDAWAAAMPGGLAESIAVDGHPGLEACDPGEEVDMALAGRSTDALLMPALYGYLQAEGVELLGPEGARCVGLQVIRETPYEQITDPEGAAFSTDEFQERVFDAFAACGSGDR